MKRDEREQDGLAREYWELGERAAVALDSLKYSLNASRGWSDMRARLVLRRTGPFFFLRVRSVSSFMENV